MKQIAVILGAVNLDNQKKILEGLEAAARDSGVNLYVFTNYVGTQETEESVTAAIRIMKLVDFSKFDGAIMALNTIHHGETLERLLKEAYALNIPAVTIDRPMEGMSSLQVDSYEAEFEMTEHFICEHNYKDICYVSGLLEVSLEAQKRYKGFRDAMAKHNMAFNEEDMYQGGFTYDTGRDAANYFLSRGRVPEAIICGNDDMALGVMDVYFKAGYKTPDDIKIAGFDDTENSKMNNPTLTTVAKNQFETGYKAVYELLELIDGKEPEDYLVPCTIQYRESCGCMVEGGSIYKMFESMDELKRKFLDQQHDILRLSDTVRSMTLEFGKARYPHDIMFILQKYMPRIGVGRFYLCLCEMEKVFVLPERNLGQNIDVLNVNENYTPMIEIPLAYENGEYNTYQRFEKGFVLPEELREGSGGNTYLINQIYYENCCYGYAISDQHSGVIGSGLYQSILMEIAVGLEIVRKWMLLKDAVERLNGMWCYDNMTHLYNRSGFYNEAGSLLERFKNEDKEIFILFMDADGLKKINDNIGHEAGDRMIQAVADIIRRNTKNNMLSMRYGGDEFVLFGAFSENDTIQSIEDLQAAIESDIKVENESGKYEFTLSVSTGGSSWAAKEVDDLGALIEKADQEMYEHKREKKKKLQQG